MKFILKTIFTYSPLLVWLIICIMVFVYISRISFVTIFTITSWKPFVEMLSHISLLRYTLDLLSALLGVIIFSLACLSLGLNVLRIFIQLQSSKVAQGVTAFLIGEILFSVIFLSIISLYRLTPSIVAITISLGFLAGLPAFKAFIVTLPSYSNISEDFELSEKLILALVIAGLVLSLLFSSTRLGYDATAEYFSQAKIMAVSQLPIFFHPEYPFVVSSFHPGILFTVLIQLFGDQAARLLPWVNGVAILLLGIAIGRESRLTQRACLWFLTLMITSTAFVDLLGDGKIEIISTAPILAAVYWMLRSLEQPTKGTFTVIGLLVGFALISRPYNIFLVSVFMALFYISQIYARKRADTFDFKRFIQLALWSLPPMLILGIFHLLENWFFLQDPFAPMAYAQGLSENDWQWQFDPANLITYRLIYPITVTFINSSQSLGNISPLLVGFLPFLFVRKVRENLHISAPLRRLSLVALLTLLPWIAFFFTVVEIRYVLFLWVILFLTTSQVLESATQHAEILFRPLLRSLVIVFLVSMGIRTLLIAVTTYFPLDAKRQTRCQDSNLCIFLDTINRPARPGDRVLVLHAYRYYLRPDLFACSSQVHEYAVLKPLAHQNSPDFWVKAYRQGYKFIMFEQHLSEDRYNFGKLPSPDIAPNWINIQVLYSSANANQKIYQLEATDPPIQPEISCKQNAAGQWELTRLSISQP